MKITIRLQCDGPAFSGGFPGAELAKILADLADKERARRRDYGPGHERAIYDSFGRPIGQLIVEDAT